MIIIDALDINKKNCYRNYVTNSLSKFWDWHVVKRLAEEPVGNFMWDNYYLFSVWKGISGHQESVIRSVSIEGINREKINKILDTYKWDKIHRNVYGLHLPETYMLFNEEELKKSLLLIDF